MVVTLGDAKAPRSAPPPRRRRGKRLSREV